MTEYISGQYIVPVSYAPLPPLSELEKEFSGHNSISYLFDGSREWQKHPACSGMTENSGERAMVIARFEKRITSEQAIALGKEHGCRPATAYELLAFARANLGLKPDAWIAALGSFVVEGARFVVLFGCLGGMRLIRDFLFDTEWESHDHFLFVREYFRVFPPF